MIHVKAKGRASATSVNRRPENGDDTRSKMNDTFEYEQAPLLTAAGRAYTGYDRKDAIDEHVSRDDDD